MSTHVCGRRSGTVVAQCHGRKSPALAINKEAITMDTAVLEKPAAVAPEGTGGSGSEAVRRLRRRAKVLRRRGVFSPTPPPGLEIRRASSFADLEAAYRLVHDCFVEQGYIDPHPSGLRVRAHSALPGTALYAAVEDGQVVGTMSVIPDGQLGLPMESAFGPEITALRRRGRRLVEVSDLAIAPGARNMRVLTELMRCVFAHSIVAGADDMVIAISPKHAALFENILLFEPLGSERSYSPQKLDIVEGKRLGLVSIREKVQGLDRILAEDAFLEEFFFETNPYFELVQEWSVLGELMAADTDLFVDFFVKRAALLARCSERELGALATHYPAVALWRSLAEREVEPAWQRGKRLTQVLRCAPPISN